MSDPTPQTVTPAPDGASPTRADVPEFRSDSVWQFYGAVVKHYWKRFSGMMSMTVVYTGIDSMRLLLVGTLIAAIEIKSDREGGSSKILEKVESAWAFLSGQTLDLTGRLRSQDEEFFYNFVVSIAVVFAISACLMAAAYFIKEYIAQAITMRATVDVRKALFNHLTRQSVSYFNRQQSGDVISRLTNDVGLVQLSFRFFFVTLIQEPVRVVVLLSVAAWASPVLFVITVPFYVLIMWPLVRASRKVLRHGRGRQEKLGVVTEAIQQLFGGIRIVKAFGMEASEQSNFAGKNKELIRSSLQMVRAKAKGQSIQELLYNLGVAAFVFGGVWLFTKNVIDLAILSVFIGALIQTYRPIKAMSRAWNILQESRAGVERVIEVLQEQPAIVDDQHLPEFPGVENEICFDRVSFSYERELAEESPTFQREVSGAEESSQERAGGKKADAQDDARLPAVRSVSLRVRRGEVVAIVGPSGAGKSTLVDLLARFYDPQDGAILVDGVDIRSYRHSSFLRGIAVVSQDPFLFNTTILENIRYGREDAAEAEVVEAAKAALAHEFTLEQPDGYETVIGDRGVRLSGGQRQRLTIARAVLKNAPILILDEATSSLDTQSEREVQRALNNLMKNRTTFVIAHRLSTVVHADKIVVLEEGSPVEVGRHEELLARRGRYFQLWQSQSLEREEDGSAA